MSLIPVRVLYFAAVCERIGCTEEVLGIPATACDDRALLAFLAERHPLAAPLLAPCRIAVEHDFVRGTFAVRPGIEIAVIPPVSGG